MILYSVMIDSLMRIHSEIGDIINGISNDEYSNNKLIAYVNDSLMTLSEYVEYVISLSK